MHSMRQYLAFAVSLACGFLWLVVFVPIVSRLFGVRVPMSLRKRGAAIRQLRFVQYVSVNGVLGFGASMFIVTFCDGYLRWRLLGDSYARPSVGGVVFHLVLWLAGGAFFGLLLGWNERHQRGEKSPSR